MVGVEASPLLGFLLLRAGLPAMKTGRQDVDAAMRRINAVHAKADDYLKNVPTGQFLTRFYFDPMFPLRRKKLRLT